MLLSRVGILNLGRVTGLSCLRTTPASQRYGALLTKPGITGPTLTYVPHFLKLKRRPSRRYIRNRAYPSWKGNSTVEDEITNLRVKKSKNRCTTMYYNAPMYVRATARCERCAQVHHITGVYVGTASWKGLPLAQAVQNVLGPPASLCGNAQTTMPCVGTVFVHARAHIHANTGLNLIECRASACAWTKHKIWQAAGICLLRVDALQKYVWQCAS